MEQEVIWMPVKDLPNYEVNNLGEVRRTKTKKILKPYLGERGYYVVTFYDVNTKKQRGKKLNRVVWESFNDCDCAEVVDHIDNIKTNNNLNNLRCITYSENVKRRVQFERKNKYNLTKEMKIEIITNYRKGLWSSIDIMKKYGIQTNYFFSAVTRGTWDRLCDEPILTQ